MTSAETTIEYDEESNATPAHVPSETPRVRDTLAAPKEDDAFQIDRNAKLRFLKEKKAFVEYEKELTAELQSVREALGVHPAFQATRDWVAPPTAESPRGRVRQVDATGRDVAPKAALEQTKTPAKKTGKKGGRTASPDSASSKVLAYLGKHADSSAGDIAKALGEETPKISQILNLHKKAGRVKSKGDRGSMTFRATNGAA
jgi:hypothetical protein